MFDPFQKYIQRAANRYGISTEMRAAEVCHYFRTMIPKIFENKKDAEKYIQPAYFKKNTLVVNVETPAWGQEIIMRKEKIISEMNQKIGKQVINNLTTQLRN